MGLFDSLFGSAPQVKMSSQAQAYGQGGKDYQDEAENRRRQQAFLDAIGATAQGQGPVQDAAAAQLRQGINEANASADSAIAGNRGLSPATAAYLVSQRQGAMGQNAAAGAAGLRAQLAMNAQGLQGNAIQGARQQDLGLIGLNADNYNKANTLNTQIGLTQAEMDQRAAQAGLSNIGGLLNSFGGAASWLGPKLFGSSGGGGGGNYVGAGGPSYGQPMPTNYGMAEGGEVSMDDPANDIVPARMPSGQPVKLSPGEVVIPRSVMAAKDAGQRAMRLVEAIKAQNDAKNVEPGESDLVAALKAQVAAQHAKLHALKSAFVPGYAGGGELRDSLGQLLQDAPVEPDSVNLSELSPSYRTPTEVSTADRNRGLEEYLSGKVSPDEVMSLMDRGIIRPSDYAGFTNQGPNLKLVSATDGFDDSGAKIPSWVPGLGKKIIDFGGRNAKSLPTSPAATGVGAPQPASQPAQYLPESSPNAQRSVGAEAAPSAPVQPPEPVDSRTALEKTQDAIDVNKSQPSEVMEAIERNAGIDKRVAEQSAQMHRDELARRNADLAQYKQDIADNQAKLKQTIDERPDPTRWWKEHSTGSKVSAGIGLFLSAIGSGLAGQQNKAQEFLQGEIDKDLNLQLKRKDSLISYFQDKGHTIQESYGLAQSVAQQNVADRMGALAAQTTSDKMRNDLLLQKQQWEWAARQNQMGIAQKMADIQKSQSETAKNNMDTATKGLELSVYRKALEGGIGGTGFNIPLTLPEMQKRGVNVDGKLVWAKPDMGDKAQALVANYDNFRVAAAKVRDFMARSGTGSSLVGDKAAEADQLVQQLQDAYFMSKGVNLSALTPTEQKVHKESFPRLSSLSLQDRSRALKDLEDEIGGIYRNGLRSYTDYTPASSSARKY